jgi:large subunit ribosomal protein L19e
MKTQKRLAAKLLHVGLNRVRIDVKDTEAVTAITTDQIRAAIRKGAIYAKPLKGISKKKPKKTKRRAGSRKGKKTARASRKEAWIKKIRAQRKILKDLRSKQKITPKEYRKLYLLTKGGRFRDKAHLLAEVKH